MKHASCIVPRHRQPMV